MDQQAAFRDKRVLVTGGAGSVGSELIRQLLLTGAAEVRALDNHERGIFELEERFGKDGRLQTFLCDVRNGHEVERLFGGVDYAFHTAALKSVPICERSPFSTVQTNVLGTENVIRAAMANRLSRVIFTSSDKAVNPTNVMGTSKLMGERLMTAANAVQDGRPACIFASNRFGNVVGSSGSVVPLFAQQIAAGGPVTLTDEDMTRFIMTVEEAVAMLLDAMILACGGEVFVTRMPVVRIADLARVMVRLLAPAFGRRAEDVVIETIGARPGEKMYEELTTAEEMRRTIDLGRYLVVFPAFRHIYGGIDYVYPEHESAPAEHIYNSANETPIGENEIEEFLMKPGVLPAEAAARLG